MSFSRISALAAITFLGITACAGRGIGPIVGGSEPLESGGIRTRAMQAAPAAQEAQNESRPLSELNTPDAIAAREAAARGGFSSAAAPPVAPAAPQYPAATAAEPAIAASNPHNKVGSLQKGAKVRVRSDAALRARPSASGDSVPMPPGVLAELGPQIYNAGGYWWYVTAGKDSGWILQSDLLP